MSKSENTIRFDFSVGPATLHSKVGVWMQRFVDEGWGSCSHRSEKFMQLYRSMQIALRKFTGLSDEYCIFLADSGSTIMEKLIQGLVQENCYQFVMGAFGQKQKIYAERLGKNVQDAFVPSGESFHSIPQTIFPNTQLISLTHCETSSGTQLSNQFLEQLRNQYPDIPINLDMVSTAPLTGIDLNLFESFFFSCQKIFGLPSGLGIWCIRRDLAAKGANNINGGAHERLSEYLKNYDKDQPVSTPNILGVYLLEKVLQDFLNTGKSTLIRQMKARKKLLIDAIDKCSMVTNHVKNIQDQSDSIFVLDLKSQDGKLQKRLLENGMVVSDGYRAAKNSQLRIANFPAIPDEAYDLLYKILSNS